MREIWFRGKDIETEDWVDGFYVCLNCKEHRIYSGYAETDCGDYYPDYYSVIPKTVGQFTGFTDKNDDYIFEGDVMNNAGNVVEFCNGSFCINGDSDLALWTHTEIIGNIHDNPELR